MIMGVEKKCSTIDPCAINDVSYDIKLLVYKLESSYSNICNSINEINSCLDNLRSFDNAPKSDSYTEVIETEYYISTLTKQKFWNIILKNTDIFSRNINNSACFTEIEENINNLKMDSNNLKYVSAYISEMIRYVANVFYDGDATLAGTSLVSFFSTLSKDETWKNNENKFDKFNFPELKNPDARYKYTYDKDGYVNLTQYHPLLQEKMDLLVQKCAEQGIPIVVNATLRTVAKQEETYAKGRDENGNVIGKVVTHAQGKTYQSMHQWGAAFDFYVNIPGHEWDGEYFDKVGPIGKSIGLEWGGDWEGDKQDRPHFQLPGCTATGMKEKYGDPSKYVDTW